MDQLGIDSLMKRLQKYMTNNSNTRLLNPMIQLLTNNNLSIIQNNFDKIVNDLRRELNEIDDELYDGIKTIVNSDLNYC